MRAARVAIAVAAAAPARCFFTGAGRRLLRRLGRSPRAAPAPAADDDGPAIPRITLHRQEALPEDLRLPPPADPVRRIIAGCIDAGVAVAAGAAVAVAAQATGLAGDAVEVAATAQGVALAGWLLRDALTADGNRSLGKRLMRLEVAYWDGALVTRPHAVLRNVHWAALAVMPLHPLLELAGTLPFVFDVVSAVFTVDGRKVGDYLAGSRVVEERPGRAARLDDLRDALEMRQLRAEIEEEAPGWLASSTDERDRPLEAVQRAIVAAEAAGLRAAPAAVAAPLRSRRVDDGADGGSESLALGAGAAPPTPAGVTLEGAFAEVDAGATRQRALDRDLAVLLRGDAAVAAETAGVAGRGGGKGGAAEAAGSRLLVNKPPPPRGR